MFGATVERALLAVVLAVMFFLLFRPGFELPGPVMRGIRLFVGGY